jgi:hypothetical protein
MPPLIAVVILAIAVGLITRKLAMNINEVAGKVTDLVITVKKIAEEIKKLKASLENTQLPPAAVAAFEELDTALKGADALNEDEPETPTEDPEAPTGRRR